MAKATGDFSGKVVLITGASGNLGSAVAKRFAQDGASLALVDINAERVQKVADALKDEFGVKVMAQSADLGDVQAVDALIAAVAKRFTHIDVLAHTVGGFAMGKDVTDLDFESYDKMMALNVKPVFVMGGAVAKHMLDAEIAGKIVIVLARSGLKGAKGQSAYTASKAAAQRIMESLSLEVRDHGINVNGVMPSTIDTPPNRESMPKADFDKWVTPQQIADSIAFLASEAASALHGVSLEVYNRA
jgi:NAD(P)-dependent dehydrogenase (short-subunit alcohol dehydrogenase family)